MFSYTFASVDSEELALLSKSTRTTCQNGIQENGVPRVGKQKRQHGMLALPDWKRGITQPLFYARSTVLSIIKLGGGLQKRSANVWDGRSMLRGYDEVVGSGRAESGGSGAKAREEFRALKLKTLAGLRWWG